MEMRQCARAGHFYDASLHTECPYCKSAGAGVTIPLDIGRTMGVAGPNAYETPNRADGGRTVAVIKETLGFDPVVGWLVCVEGNNIGRDYRLHAENNYIGRGENMDVRIEGDESISRGSHAAVVYDTRDKTFYLAPGDSRGIVRLNEKAVLSTAVLEAYDVMEVGKTRLMFVPMCGERFDWSQDAK